MAQTICCPCGNPIDCDHVELVITVSCPRCNRELALELDGAFAARRAMITIMDGPHWIGERFILPVGIDLAIGRASGNWLSLDADTIADAHCRLKLAPNGALIVEDLSSPGGTWIGNQRILRGKLAPTGAFRVGPFRFRFDIQTPEGNVVTPVAQGYSDSDIALPTMTGLKRKNTPIHWAARNRFVVARWVVISMASIGGAGFGIHLHERPVMPWNWNKAILAGLAVWLVLSFAGRRVALIHNQLKYVSLGALIVLAVIGLAAGAAAFASAAFCAAACLVILIMREPHPWLALIAALIGLFGVFILVRDVVQTLMAIASAG